MVTRPGIQRVATNSILDRLKGRTRSRLQPGPERLKRGPAFDRSIRSLLVVVKTESVELKLEVSLSFLEFKIGRWWGFEGAGTRSVRDLSPLIAAAFAPPPRPLPPSSGH